MFAGLPGLGIGRTRFGAGGGGPPPPMPSITSVSPPIAFRAASGVSLTLAGSGFTGATGVTIGGIAATSVIVVNDTTITCVTPALTRAFHNVTVTGPGGSGTLASGYCCLPSVLWLRADRGITIATGVSLWADQSGNGADAGENTATTSRQPGYTTSNANFNGQATVDFDGVDDALTGTGLTLSGTTRAFYAVLRLNANSAASNSGIISLADSVNMDNRTPNGSIWLRLSATQVGQHSASDGGTRSTVSGIANNTTYVMSSRFDGTNNTFRVNTTDGTPVSAATSQTPTRYAVGARLFTSPVSDFTPVSMAEVLAFGFDLTASENTALRSHWQARYGVAS